jgi:hypothetical protein
MITLIFILIAIALVDSTSMIPISLLPLATILGGKHPIAGGLFFIFGIFLVYSLSGMLLLFFFNQAFEVISPSISRWWNQPNTAELIFQLIIGVALLIYAWKQYRRPQIPMKNYSTESISPTLAFTYGASLTVIGVPGAIPYFGAIEQIIRADLNYIASISTLIIYNIVFVAPFFALILIRMLAPNQSEYVFGSISLMFKRLSKPAIVSCFVILGTLLAADSISWLLGYPYTTDKLIEAS